MKSQGGGSLFIGCLIISCFLALFHGGWILSILLWVICYGDVLIKEMKANEQQMRQEAEREYWRIQRYLLPNKYEFDKFIWRMRDFFVNNKCGTCNYTEQEYKRAATRVIYSYDEDLYLRSCVKYEKEYPVNKTCKEYEEVQWRAYLDVAEEYWKDVDEWNGGCLITTRREDFSHENCS